MILFHFMHMSLHIYLNISQYLRFALFSRFWECFIFVKYYWTPLSVDVNLMFSIAIIWDRHISLTYTYNQYSSKYV